MRRSVLTTWPASRASRAARARIRAPLRGTTTPLSSTTSSGPRTRTCTSGGWRGGRPGWHRRGGRPATGWGRRGPRARRRRRPTTRRGRRWRWGRCGGRRRDGRSEWRSWHFHLADLVGRRALGDVPGELAQGLFDAGRVDLPPDGVSPERAGGDGDLVAQRAVEAAPGGEDHGELR